ncbi:MAG: histidinol dehydrogenase [Spirochaetaceae bacterium]|jgi:histidinol dehydrogenase|nr:histidinol dehydrogenase [Spirochaetaceae bacterium]
MKIITEQEFNTYWKNRSLTNEENQTTEIVRNIIADVRKRGDAALWEYTKKFETETPKQFEIPFSEAEKAYTKLKAEKPELICALEYAAHNIYTFATEQKKQFSNFEIEIAPGLFTGQKVIPLESAALYIPGGKYPLMSTVLMTVIPALVAGVEKIVLLTPPPVNNAILAALYVCYNNLYKNKEPVSKLNSSPSGGGWVGASLHIYTLGGAQAVAAVAFGTETIPRCDIIAGPGNAYVAEAKRQLYGTIGIDLIAGPTDVLLLCDATANICTVAADLLAQAEHDPNAAARCLLPNSTMAETLQQEIEKQLDKMPTKETAQKSLDNNGLIILYDDIENALAIANTIAPEHMELQIENAEQYIDKLHNYGSLFIGENAAEVLGDYSAGINHTLPTLGTAHYTGGLSVRNFLKTPTTLSVTEANKEALEAARLIAEAEGLAGHAQAAKIRHNFFRSPT